MKVVVVVRMLVLWLVEEVLRCLEVGRLEVFQDEVGCFGVLANVRVYKRLRHDDTQIIDQTPTKSIFVEDSRYTNLTCSVSTMYCAYAKLQIAVVLSSSRPLNRP